MKYDVVIGLELHIELCTRSKLFSSSPVTYGEIPNTMTSVCDFAFPGIMPTLNIEAVVKAIQLCNALNMTIDRNLIFDRKNYYYSDLPKNYQITQESHPIGRDGYLNINNPNEEPLLIKINRAHLEEDTCKQIHNSNETLLDYNRAGIPLIEIVTEPVIKNGDEAKSFVDKIRSVVSFLNISNGKMEEGSLRCDINISLRENETANYGTKVEIKNINSIANIKKAIDFEISRQSRILDENGIVAQETRRYDDANQETVSMRIKSDNVDYRCFIDPNIPCFKISDEFIDRAISNCRPLPDLLMSRYLDYGLSISLAKYLVSDFDLANYFEELVSYGSDPKISANWLSTSVQSYLNANDLNIKKFKISSKKLSEVIIMIQEKFISHKFAKDIFELMLLKDVSAKEAAAELKCDSSIDDLDSLIEEVVSNNEKSVADIKNGKDKAFGYLLGQVLKRCSSNISPSLVRDKLIKKLED